MMYWIYDADYRAAKAAMIASMDEGYPWQEAAAKAGVVVSRATAYRLWLRWWREGRTCLDDGWHGHPSKLREPIRHWTDADGQAQTETEWTRCATWGKLAEIAAQGAHKGSRVYVAGRLHTSRWEDAQTGEPRCSVEIVVDDLILLDRPHQGSYRRRHRRRGTRNGRRTQ